ncbi:MAG: hypothetical protein ABSE93_24880 [Terriglobia bacterium]|jgi:hypothetical protein
MNDEKQLKDNDDGSVNLGRHKAQCTICSSPYRQQIEEAFIGWGSTELIGKKYDVSRDAQYRHAHAFGLFGKRQRNIRVALERIIERADFTPMNGSVIVSAIKAYAKINSEEQVIEQAQGKSPKKLLERLSKEQRESFVRDGSLPDWFPNGVGATLTDGQEGEKESQVTETKGLQ